MSNQSVISSLLGGIEFDDPRLYDLLALLSNDLYKVYNQLNPPSVQSFGATGQAILPNDVSGFVATLFNNNLKLNWSAVDGFVSYELRYKAGSLDETAWDTASTILRTGTLSADINPLIIPLTTGSHTFLLKAVDNNGSYSSTPAILIISIAAITSPSVSTVIITNFVLLSWSTPVSTWLIDHYNIYKNGVLQGRVSGTFEAIFETVGGTFTYVVEPVDIVGNVGTPSSGVTVAVSNPVDFTLHASLLTDDFSGSKTSCFAYNEPSLA